jgi:hypothetical protein
MPFKTWSIGEEVLASEFNPYVQQQVVARFASAAARTAAITSPVLNQVTMRDDRPGALERWTGSAWADILTKTELSYTEFTAQVAITATSEASANAVVQAPALTLDGATTILLDAFMPAVVPAATAGAILFLWLYQDGVPIGRLGSYSNPAAGQFIVPGYVSRRFTPSAGNHAYTLGATVSGGNGTIFAGVGGLATYLPGYLRINRV